MGWTYFEKPQNVSKWFAEQLTWETDTKINRCLKTGILERKEAYAAVESINKETGEREVWAATFLLNYTREAGYNFGYKDMTEHMGPYITRCPKSILELLTPTDNEYANQWRQSCRDYHAVRDRNRSVEVADLLMLEDTITLTTGVQVNLIQVHDKKKGHFLVLDPETGQPKGGFRWTKWRDGSFNKLSHEQIGELTDKWNANRAGSTGPKM